MTRLQDVMVAQQTSDAQIVGWRYVPFESPDVDAARVTVYRAYSETGDFEEIDTVPATQGWFEDINVYLKDRWVIPFYKLALKDGAKTTTYGPVRVKGVYDRIALHIVRQHKIYLRRAGVPVLVYQTLVSGRRCPTCYDTILGKATLSQCPSCFNTGYETGYAPPVFTLAAVGVENKSNQLTTRVDQDSSVDMLFSTFPVLRPKDVVYVVDTGLRYSVSAVAPVEKHLCLVHQAVGCVSLKPDDIENTLPIPDLSKTVPILSRKIPNTRKLSSTDGEEFDNKPFKISKI